MAKSAPGPREIALRQMREANWGISQAEMRQPREKAKNAERSRMLDAVAKPKAKKAPPPASA